jgi:hypothetical protein
MIGSTSTGAAAGTRVAGRLAVGLGLLTVALGAGALLLQLPGPTQVTLRGRIPQALEATVGAPFSVMGALICVRRPGNRIGWLLLVSGLSYTAFNFAARPVTYGRPFAAPLLLASGSRAGSWCRRWPA